MDVQFHNWLVEQTDPNEIHLYKRTSKIEAKPTKFQSVEFVESVSYGTMLVLDGAIQSAEDDEYLYHEALVHPGMITHPNPKQVLVIGGGEGATLREVFKHPTVESVVMVDIDQELVEMCQERLGSWHQGAFKNPKLTLLHEDGRAYLEKTDAQFDVIISDITDILEEGPALALYTKEFYALCRERLTPDGVLVVQALELTPTDWTEHATLARTIAASFEIVRSYIMFVPAFICTWGYLIATNSTDPAALPASEIARRIQERNLEAKLESYDEITHLGMFCLPKDLRKNLAKPGSLIEDGKPLVFDREEED